MDIDINYIVHEREDYIRKTNIYKIGLSGNIFRRMPAYPKGSKLVFMSSSPHMKLVEDELIKIFSVMFIQRLDRGREYFQGDLETMKRIMMDTISYYNNAIPDNQQENNNDSTEKQKASITIGRHAHNYLIGKRNKKNFITIKNFIKDKKIITNKSSFLKIKDVRLLWNAKYNSNFSENSILNLLFPILGDVIVDNGLLGWKVGNFNNTTDIINDNNIYKIDENIYKYKQFRKLYLIETDDNEYIKWTEIIPIFKAWHKSTYKNKYRLSNDIILGFIAFHKKENLKVKGCTLNENTSVELYNCKTEEFLDMFIKGHTIF